MMKNKILVGLTFLFVLAMIPSNSSALVGGWTKMDFITNYQGSECSPIANGKAWVVSWTDTGYTTDRLFGSLQPDDVYDLTNGKFNSEDSFTIEADATNDGCFYVMNRGSDKKVHTIDVIRSPWFWASDTGFRDSWVSNNCDSYEYTTNCNGLTQCDVSCWAINEYIGTPGAISSPQYEFETEWTVSVPGKGSMTSKICTGIHDSDSECNGISTTLGQYGCVKWGGSLITGKCCEEPHQVLAMHGNSFSEGWRVTSERDYADWKYHTYSGPLTQNIHLFAGGGMDEYTIENLANNLANAAIVPESSTNPFMKQWINGNPYVEDSSFSRGILRWSPVDDRLTFPTFTLYLDADYYLKVIMPTGEPQIVSVDISNIDEGETEPAIINVRNKGSYEGGFDVWIDSCTYPFSASNNHIPVTLAGGASKTITDIEITFASTSSTDKDISGSCIVKMKETTTQEVAQKLFDVTGTQMNECTPGQKGCYYGEVEGRWAIQTCKTDGLTYSYDWCSPNEICDGAVCKAGSCIKEDEACYLYGTPCCGGLTCEGTGILGTEEGICEGETCLIEGEVCFSSGDPCCEGLECTGLPGETDVCTKKSSDIDWDLIMWIFIIVAIIVTAVVLVLAFKKKGKR